MSLRDVPVHDNLHGFSPVDWKERELYLLLESGTQSVLTDGPITHQRFHVADWLKGATRLHFDAYIMNGGLGTPDS
jgi:hypothetical protein